MSSRTSTGLTAAAAATIALVLLAACGSSTPSTPTPTPTPPPPPMPEPVAAISSFALAPADGTVPAGELGWRVVLRLGQRVPGLFVRVDLETGIYGQGEACYASELAVATAVDAQAALEISGPAFVRSPRPGSACEGKTFRPEDAQVRVFDSAEVYARQPVTSGHFPVAVTVTE